MTSQQLLLTLSLFAFMGSGVYFCSSLLWLAFKKGYYAWCLFLIGVALFLITWFGNLIARTLDY